MDIIEIEKAIVSEILQDKGRPLAWFGLVNDIKPEMFTSPKLGKAYEMALGGNYDIFDVAEKSGLKSSEVVSMVIDYNGFLGLATVDGFIENEDIIDNLIQPNTTGNTENVEEGD
jgi:hypothetical protein